MPLNKKSLKEGSLKNEIKLYAGDFVLWIISYFT